LTAKVPVLFPSYNGALDYMSIDGSPVYDTTATFTAVEGHDFTITAYYQNIPTCMMTVNAYDDWTVGLNPAVYIDGNYVGTAPVSIQVPIGSHTLYLSDPIWDSWLYSDVYLQSILDSNYQSYSNGGNVALHSDMTFNARY
jgi:hypothetical protein